ncbi:MAG: PmoA family protein [Planctomycetes bacterium]|nr:PmoA family protein [Planctomycetota bacterium]
MRTILPLVVFVLAGTCLGEEPFAVRRCELVPLPDQQASFTVDGVEKTRWHFGAQYPRPFFYPFCGPSGTSLTRMGHPGAENHDHHRSVWFAHHDVGGVDFWSDGGDGRVRQKSWLSYRDGDDEAIMASALGWFDGAGKELMEQDVVAALIPLEGGEHVLELQITMRPPAGAKTVELGKTNFGFLAVRVAKTLSVHFGGGRLADSEGRQGEKAIFGNQARWMDYSGPVAVGQGPSRKTVTEGITYFDHPDNPRYPTSWHVREDGWMGASFCMHEGCSVTAESPLVLRYLLHAHGGAYEAAKAQSVHERFAKRSGLEITKSSKPHRQYDVGRKAASESK